MMPICRWPLRLIAVLPLAGNFAGSLRAQDEAAAIAAIWNDPTFKKQFIGGYGINAEIEPRVTKDEVALLEKVRPLMSENPAKAESLLTSAINEHSSAILDFTLGGIQFQQDRMPEALANHRIAVTKFPSFRRAWRNLGLIHTKLANHDETIHAFTRMIELGGGDAYAYGLLGFAHAQKQDYQPAEAAFRSALLLQPENTQWRLGLVQCVFKQQKFEDANALLSVLIARSPEKSEYWLLQAHALLGLKQPLHAAENLEVVDRLGKATVDSSFTLGDIYLNENLPDLAAGAYARAIAKDPKQPLARPMRAAETLAARGALPQARRLTARMHDTIKDIPDADRRKLLKLEARFSMADGFANDDVTALLEDIVKIDPLDGEALLLLGKHYQKKGESDRAILYFERAANIEACEAEAKVREAQVLVASLSRYAEAIPLLRRAQQIKPREEVARYLEQVERIARSQR